VSVEFHQREDRQEEKKGSKAAEGRNQSREKVGGERRVWFAENQDFTQAAILITNRKEQRAPGVVGVGD